MRRVWAQHEGEGMTAERIERLMDLRVQAQKVEIEREMARARTDEALKAWRAADALQKYGSPTVELGNEYHALANAEADVSMRRYRVQCAWVKELWA